MGSRLGAPGGVRVKILFVTHRYPPRTGGVETHVREIATRLADHGHDVTVFSADAGDNLPSRTTDDGVRVRRFHSVSPDDSLYLAPQMAIAIRRADADVVHAHNYHAFPLFFAAISISDEQFVVTTHYHGASANGIRDVLLSGYKPFGRWAVRQADEVIAVSEWERDRLREDFAVEATVIPNGVNVERFAEAEPERRDRPYLLCVGRLEEYKGIQHVIRALTVLPDYGLVIAGSGPYRKELEQIAHDAGVSHRVEFLGHVDDDRLPSLYAGADVYVTMSKFEAYGMTVAEGLASGTPCVIRTGSALSKWLPYSAVFSISDTDPDSVMSIVQKAASSQPNNSRLPTWQTVVKDVETQYSSKEPN